MDSRHGNVFLPIRQRIMTVRRRVGRNRDPEVQWMPGQTGFFGPDPGLSRDWAVRAISAVGGYGEIFKPTSAKTRPSG